MKVTYKQKNNYLNDNDNEIWRGFTTMIPAHKHPYLILQATKRMPVARVQWPSTAVNKLTDLAHSGQFKGKTWLPYTRIAQYTDSTLFLFLLVQ